jgi:hypothetical protein
MGENKTFTLFGAVDRQIMGITLMRSLTIVKESTWGKDCDDEIPCHCCR